MDRRDFLKTTGTAIAGATLSHSALAQGTSATGLPLSHGRMIFPIDRNWRYNPSFVQGAHDKQFDDSSFQKIAVPHTNIQLPWHGFDDKSYQFVSIYRRRFKVPPVARERRIFVDFEGVMTAATVWINGVRLGEYKGGYTPFSFELTPHLNLDGENVLAVDVDSTERPDIPPFGHQIDYLTFGGIYRQVALRAVPSAFIDDLFAYSADTLTPHPRLTVDCHLRHLEELSETWTLEVELRDDEKVLAKVSKNILPSAASAEPVAHSLVLQNLSGIKLWDLSSPYLYQMHARLFRGGELVDNDSRRIGFREAQFTDHGFELNDKVVKLRGLDRHQTFPFAGQAMPARLQRRDAEILRNQFKCNIVRTSHYPQSRHFLDACDELGLLVLEEIPGWQHIGDESWKLLAVDNVRRMIRRDAHHPAIILWGVRINESHDDHDFYSRTNALARQLDPTRQTGGIRNFQGSEFLEDVFTMNDFDFPLLPPNHPRYLNTEFCGHTFPTKTIDNKERLQEHTVRHARVHDQLASNPKYAGGIGWCAFDYNTHADFGSGDRVCYHGVADIFREPKPAAGFYKSQCDPAEEVVLEPAFHWAPGDESIGFKKAMVCSNCDHLKFYIGGKLVAEAAPDTAQFPHLRYAPFTVDLEHKVAVGPWGDLRIEGYIRGKQVITKNFSGKGIDAKFLVLADDTRLDADGADCTRVVFRVADEFGAVRPFADAAIQLHLEGPAELIGDNPFALVGGTGAVWIRAKEQPGAARLIAVHPALGKRQVEFEVLPVPPEIA